MNTPNTLPEPSDQPLISLAFFVPDNAPFLWEKVVLTEKNTPFDSVQLDADNDCACG